MEHGASTHCADRLPRALPALLAACLILATPGCETVPRPPSEAVRAKLGTIGLVYGGALTDVRLRKPMGKGEGTASGAAGGFLWGLDAGAQAGKGGGQFGAAMAVVVWAITVPIGTVVGAADGNLQGLSTREMAEAKQTIEQLRPAVLGMELPAMLNREVIRAITNSTRHPVVLVSYADLACGGEQLSYQPLTNSQINTALEATIITAGLAGPRSRNAPLSAFLEIRVRLVRVQDDSELYVRRWFHHGGSRTLAEWGTSQGRALSGELANAVPNLAGEIVEELFLRYRP